MSGPIAAAADLLVATLLVATIVSSVRLSRRMTALKADESAMRAMIAELLAATESAERATGTLRATLADADRNLADKLGAADRASRDLAGASSAGEGVIDRLHDVIEATRRACQLSGMAARPTPAPQASGLGEVLANARALAERSSRRAGASRS